MLRTVRDYTYGRLANRNRKQEQHTSRRAAFGEQHAAAEVVARSIVQAFGVNHGALIRVGFWGVQYAKSVNGR